MEHRGVTCDGCGIKNFTGARYRCNVCSDYDLCSNCYQNDASSLNHVPEHPVTAILPPGHGFGMPDQEVTVYTCPYCDGALSGDNAFIAHMYESHDEEEDPVLCNICTLSGFSEMHYGLSNFREHLSASHGRGGRGGRRRGGRGGGRLFDDGAERSARKLLARQPQESKSLAGASSGEFQLGRDSLELGIGKQLSADAVSATNPEFQALRAAFVKELVYSTLIDDAGTHAQ